MRFGLLSLLLLVLAPADLVLGVSGRAESANPDSYSHGTTVCLQGRDGPGIRLRLRQRSECESNDEHPYLQIDIRELPLEANKSVVIGETNWAFECPNPKMACRQFASGQVMLNHVPDVASGWRAEGWYELRFNRGEPWTGHFKVDCIAVCG